MNNPQYFNEGGYPFVNNGEGEAPQYGGGRYSTSPSSSKRRKNPGKPDKKWKLTVAILSVLTIAMAFVLFIALSSVYNNLTPKVDKLSEDSDNAAVILGDAEYAYRVAHEEATEAKYTYQEAVDKLAEVTDTLLECQSVYEQATAVYNEAKSALDDAKFNYDSAVTKLNTAEGKYATALEETEEAKKSYTSAKSEAESWQQSLEQATQKLNSATTAMNSAKTAYESAVLLYNAMASQGGESGGDTPSVIVPVTDDNPTASEVFAKVTDAVLEIRNYDVTGTYVALGTGFIFDKSGLVATNYHVISGAYELRAYYGENDDDYYEVEYVAGMDADIDIAAIKLKGEQEFPTVTLATKEPAVGDTIYALGSNTGFFKTFSTGIVAYVDKELTGFESVKYIQYFDLTHSGNSGCPIFNAAGEVIAINQLGDTATGDHGFGIPIKHLRQLTKNLKLTPMEATYRGAVVMDEKLFNYTTKFDMKAREEYVIITSFKDATSANDLVQDSVVAFPSKIDGKPVREISISFYLTDTYAEYHYYFIKHIVIPEGVKTLNGNLFYSAPKTLLTVKLPSTLTFIGEDVFGSCFGIYRFFMDKCNDSVYLKDEVLYGKDTNGQVALLRYPYCKSNFGEDPDTTDDDGEFATTKFSVPSEVKFICDFACLYSGFTELDFPGRDGSIELEIGALAFCFNTNLKKVTLPVGLNTVEARAFGACTALEEVIFEGNVKSLGEIYTLSDTGMYYGAFDSCTAITKLTFNGTVESIGDRAFLGAQITDLTLPEGITTMGKYSFGRCEKLITADLSKLQTKEVPFGILGYAEALKSVTLSENFTAIGDHAFTDCYALTSVTIPSLVEKIGDYAFYYNSKLATVDFGESSNVSAIGIYAFFNCDALTEINLPVSLKSIGAYALSNNDGLISVTISEGVKVIPEGLVFNNSKMTTLVLPSTVLRIAEGAFWKCPLLSSITLNANLPPFITAMLFEDEDDLEEPIQVAFIIPYGSMSAYMNDSAWRYYASYANIDLQEATL